VTFIISNNSHSFVATPSSGVSPSSLVGTPVMAQALSPAAEPSKKQLFKENHGLNLNFLLDTTVAEEGSLPAPVETSAGLGTSKTMVGQKPSPHDAAHTYDLIGAEESALDQRKDVDVEVDGVGATNLGQQLRLGLHSLIQFLQHYLMYGLL